MSVFSELQTAIMTAWHGTANMYHARARRNITYPYVVFNLESTPDQILNGNTCEQFTITFNIFDDNDSSARITSVAEQIKSAYESKALTLTNYVMVGAMIRETETEFVNDSDHLQHTIIFSASLME